MAVWDFPDVTIAISACTAGFHGTSREPCGSSEICSQCVGIVVPTQRFVTTRYNPHEANRVNQSLIGHVLCAAAFRT